MYTVRMTNEKIGPKSVMSTDIYGAFDNDFVVGVSHHPGSFGTSGLVKHQTRDDHILANTIGLGYACLGYKVCAP